MKLIAREEFFRAYAFEYTCAQEDMDHRLTNAKRPRTNEQVHLMNRTLKKATAKRYHFGTHAQLKEYVLAFPIGYNFAKRLKIIRRVKSYEYVCKISTKQPSQDDSE